MKQPSSKTNLLYKYFIQFTNDLSYYPVELSTLKKYNLCTALSLCLSFLCLVELCPLSLLSSLSLPLLSSVSQWFVEDSDPGVLNKTDFFLSLAKYCLSSCYISVAIGLNCVIVVCKSISKMGNIISRDRYIS